MLAAVPLFRAVPACASATKPIAAVISELTQKLPALDLVGRPAYAPPVQAYFQYYGLHFPEVRHDFGTFRSGDRQLAAHVWRPASGTTALKRNSGGATGTVIVLHGLFDHMGVVQNLVRRCLDQGLAVAGFDLPGHGLSSGPALVVEDFRVYANALATFITHCRPHLNPPFYIIGHSTGCAAALEYFRLTSGKPVARAVFLAPLLRSPYWHVSQWGVRLLRPFVDSLPRWRRKNSSDPDYLAWSRQDPLQGDHIPLVWFQSLFQWNARLRHSQIAAPPMLVIQGTADRVVDWQYNLDFLKTRLSDVRIARVAGARHQLINEQRDLWNQVWEHIAEFLNSPL